MEPQPKIRMLAVGFDGEAYEQLLGAGHRFEVISAPPDELVATSLEHVGVIVLHHGLGVRNAARVVEELHSLNCGIPIVWLPARDRPLTPFGSALPDLVWNEALGPSFAARIADLLSAHLFPEVVVDSIARAVLGQFSGSFRSPVKVERAYLAADSGGREINGFVPICGVHISGRVTVSASLPTFVEIRSANVSTTTGDEVRDAEDVAGEIANQVLGQIKRNLAEHNIRFEIGTPALWRGAGARIRFPASPSCFQLVLSSKAFEGPVLVGVSLDRLAVEEIRQTDGHAISTGDFVFL